MQGRALPTIKDASKMRKKKRKKDQQKEPNRKNQRCANKKNHSEGKVLLKSFQQYLKIISPQQKSRKENEK